MKESKINLLLVVRVAVFVTALFGATRASVDSIPIVWQDQSELALSPDQMTPMCWCAGCSMVLIYYKHIVHQGSIRAWATQNQDIGNPLYSSAPEGAWYTYDTTPVPVDTQICTDSTVYVDSESCYYDVDSNYVCDPIKVSHIVSVCHTVTVTRAKIDSTGPYHACNGVLDNYGSLTCSHQFSSVVETQLATIIHSGRPIMAAEGSIHTLVVMGYNSATHGVMYEDPLGGNVDPTGPSIEAYSDFESRWSESLILTTSAPPNIGVLPPACGIMPLSGPTQFTYTGNSATYQASFGCSPGAIGQPPSRWNWNLVFYYQGGTFSVRHFLDSNNFTGASTFYVPPFQLPPSGFEWTHNASGLVIGRVSVTTNGGDSAYAAVTYAEQNPQNLVRIRENSGAIRIYFPTIESALQDLQSNETAEVLPGTYTINSEVNLTGVTGLRNVALVFTSPNITIIPNNSIALPRDSVSQIIGIDGLTNPLNPKIILVSAVKSDVGKVRAIASSFDSALSIGQQDETIVMGKGEFTWGVPINNMSVIGVNNPDSGAFSIIRVVGISASIPPLIPGNYGTLIKNVIFQLEGTGQTENTGMIECNGAQQYGDTAKEFQFENVEFLNRGLESNGNTVDHKSVAILVTGSGGHGTLRNCIFWNFNSPYLMRNDQSGDFAWNVDACDWSGCRVGPIYLKNSADSGWTRITNSNFGPGLSGKDSSNYLVLGCGTADTSTNYGCGATTSGMAKTLAATSSGGSGPILIKAEADVLSLIGLKSNLFFVTPEYVDPLNSDFRLVSTSPLIDADTNHYTDISSIQTSTVVTSSDYLNVVVTLPGNKVVSFINGVKTIAPSIPVGAVEINEKTTNQVRPVSEIVLYQNMFGKTIDVQLSRRQGYAIPSLPDSFVVSEVATNSHRVMAFKFSELPPQTGVIDKTTTVDNTPPAMPADFTAEILNNKVVLKWAMNTEPDFKRYKVFKTLGVPVQIASLDKSNTQYTDTTPFSPGTVYSISAYDSIGNESNRNQAFPSSYIFVSSKGSDQTGNGSPASPYKTISKAVSAVPATPTVSYVISIFPGQYCENVALNNPKKGWNSAKRLSFESRYSAPDSMPLWTAKPGSAGPCLDVEKEKFVTVEGLRFQASCPVQCNTNGKSCCAKQLCTSPSNGCGSTSCCPSALMNDAILLNNDADNFTANRCLFFGTQTSMLLTGIAVGLDVDSTVIENCIFYGLADGAVEYYNVKPDQSGFKVVNNTFYGCGSAAFFNSGGHSQGFAFKPFILPTSSMSGGCLSSISVRDFIFANNIVTNSGSAFKFQDFDNMRDSICVLNCDFFALSSGIVSPQRKNKRFQFVDTLMQNPLFVSTNSVEFWSLDFMKPTLAAVLKGGVSAAFTPTVDFFNMIRNAPISIGAVQGSSVRGAQPLAKALAQKEVAAAIESATLKIYGCYPNPFRQVTSIRFEIPGSDNVPVRMEIINLEGKLVRTLVNESRAPGYYAVLWDGKSNENQPLSSGTYLCRFRAGSFLDNKRIVLVK